MELLLVINTALTTLSTVSLAVIYFLFKQASKAATKAQESATALQVAHNSHANAMENMIAKINDLETQIAMSTRLMRK